MARTIRGGPRGLSGGLRRLSCRARGRCGDFECVVGFRVQGVGGCIAGGLSIFGVWESRMWVVVRGKFCLAEWYVRLIRFGIAHEIRPGNTLLRIHA